MTVSLPPRVISHSPAIVVGPDDIKHLLNGSVSLRRKRLEREILTIILERLFRQVMSDVIRYGFGSEFIWSQPFSGNSVKFFEAP